MTTQTMAELLDRRTRFLGFVRRRVNSSVLAEDILQAAYLRAVERGAELREGDSAVAWFYRILRNSIIDHYRQSNTEHNLLERYAKERLEEDAQSTVPGEGVCQCFRKLLDNLKPAYSEILREVDLAGKPLGDFATSAGITPTNATVRSHRARKALGKEIAAFCGSCCKGSCLNCTCAA